MTKPYYIESGVEKEAKEECEACAHISRPFDVHYVGMCENFDSDHFGHVIYVMHPVCKQFEKAEKSSFTTESTKEIVRACRVCGCTDDNCSHCIEQTGQACHWVEPDLCSACQEAKDV